MWRGVVRGEARGREGKHKAPTTGYGILSLLPNLIGNIHNRQWARSIGGGRDKSGPYVFTCIINFI